jgi:hypothetical protein
LIARVAAGLRRFQTFRAANGNRIGERSHY